MDFAHSSAADEFSRCDVLRDRSTNETDQLAFSVHVVERITAAAEVVVLLLENADGSTLPPWLPGAHIDVLLDNGLERQFSLCGDPTDPYQWRIAVLREQSGRGGSAYVHDHVPAGATLMVRGPRNHFPLDAANRYLFIAGGIGITPMLPMIAEVESAGRPWELVYGGRTRASMCFLDQLTPYGERVAVHPQDECGLLNLGALLAVPRPETLVYCCGPEPLLGAVEEYCRAWDSGALRVERFTPRSVESAASGEFEVVVASSGATYTVSADQSILEVLENADEAVYYSCTEGTCGTCQTGVIEGDIEHRDSVLTDGERASGKLMMICVSRCISGRLVLDL